MFESFSPEQHLHKEPSSEKPASKSVPEKAEHSPGEQANVDEDAVLRQIEERHKRFPQELSFLSLERDLDLVLSDNALEAYKKAHYVFKKDSELPFFRLTDLGTALALLERFKDRLPNRYQANIRKVIEHADTIRQIFLDYRSLREKGQGYDLADVAALIEALAELRKIDPHRFPADLVDVTEEERRGHEAMKNITLR